MRLVSVLFIAVLASDLGIASLVLMKNNLCLKAVCSNAYEQKVSVAREITPETAKKRKILSQIKSLR